MSRLLRGDFARLLKSKIFWLGVIFLTGLAVFAVYTKWDESREFPDYYNPPDAVLLAGAVYICIVMAVFIGIFIGTDYSNGTIRNKLVVGHSRIAIYLSNLIICFTASVFMHFLYIALIVGAAQAGIIRKFQMNAAKIVGITFVSMFAVLAFSAIFLLVCMLIVSRSAGVTLAILLSLFMMMVAGKIDYRLSQKEYTDPYFVTIVTEDGSTEAVKKESVKNPKYLSGTKRKVYEFFNDLLPENQIMQMMYDEPNAGNGYLYFPFYTLSLTVFITAAGIIVFRRKDLK